MCSHMFIEKLLLREYQYLSTTYSMLRKTFDTNDMRKR